ncbi:MAG: hypothetical protein ACYTGN_06725 [Planctomycetota bacterium]|jgi:hypothetical protein
MLRIMLIVLLAAPVALAGPEAPKSLKEAVQQLRFSKADVDWTSDKCKEHFQRGYKAARIAMEHLRKATSESPKAWKTIRADLQKLPTDPERRDVKERLIDILAWDQHESSRALLKRELKADPDAFSAVTLITLDRADMPAASRRLVTLVQQEPSYYNLYAAIHLATKGDASGRRVLEWASTEPKMTERLGPVPYAIALGLRRLGDEDNWRTLVQRVTNTIEACLDEDELKRARWYVVQLEFYTGIAQSKKAFDVLALYPKCSEFAKKRMEEIETANDVRKLLEHVTA